MPALQLLLASLLAAGASAGELVRRADARARGAVAAGTAAVSGDGAVVVGAVARHQQQHLANAEANAWRTWWRWKPAASSVAQLSAKTVDSSPNSSPEGLPWAEGDKPKWLKGSDGLIVDGRKKSGKDGGMLLIHVVNQDSYNLWETEHVKRPKWLRAILAANRAHVRRHGHAMIVRWQPTGEQLTPWQIKRCKDSTDTKQHDLDGCRREYERENINWEKHLMLYEYLESPEHFSHVLMLDADALFMRPDLDTMQRMAAKLEEVQKDLFVADEDWLKHGEGRINGGVLFAKNTDFTRALFKDLWDCHRNYTLLHSRTLQDGEIGCGGNEMQSLNEWYGRRGIASKIHVASGQRWNRGGEVLYRKSDGDANNEMNARGIKDPELELMHFMGSAKFGAPDAICSQKYGSSGNLTEEGPQGYGCSD